MYLEEYKIHSRIPEVNNFKSGLLWRDFKNVIRELIENGRDKLEHGDIDMPEMWAIRGQLEVLRDMFALPDFVIDKIEEQAKEFKDDTETN